MQNNSTRKFVSGIALALSLVAAPIPAQQASVYARGLLNPAKVILGPAGTLLVSEAGDTPNSGRVSIIGSTGTRRTLIDGLPSGLSAPENAPDGPTALLLDGNSLFIAIGEGDLLANGPAQGTTVANPKGPSSPLLASVLRVDFAQAVDRIQTGFTLKAADHFVILDGNPTPLDNGAGDKATFTLLTGFHIIPDATTIYRNSHPDGLAKLDGDPGHLYMNDAGLNSLVQIDLPSGRARTITHFPIQPNYGGFGPPVEEAVPDSIRAYGSQLLVTLLTGFPFGPTNSKVVLVDPATGKVEPFINWLSSTIDIVVRDRSTRPQFFVLEFSANLFNPAGPPAPGKLLSYESAAGQVMLDGLNGPSSMVLDAAAGKLYIATRNDGAILQLDVGK